MISRLLVVAALLGSLACSLPWRVPGTGLSVEPATPGSRFAVLPINLLVPLAPELTPHAGRVQGRITRYLSQLGFPRRLIDESDARRIWRESVAWVEASNSVEHDFWSAMRVFVSRVEEPFDVIVASSLVYREARLMRGVVKWDGATRRLPRLEDDERRVPNSYGAMVSAVSLHLMVFDAGGELAFEGYGGLDLAHTFSLKPGDAGALVPTLRDDFMG